VGEQGTVIQFLFDLSVCLFEIDKIRWPVSWSMSSPNMWKLDLEELEITCCSEVVYLG
jgi:hypothetical protein